MKYALVTGSTQGIGKAIADKLEKNGYTVIRNGREKQDKENYIQADLSMLPGVEMLAATLAEQNIMLDCLVINAGTTCRKRWNEIEYEDWQKVMDLNLNMPFFLVQKLYNHIDIGGSVLFVSSGLALKPHATSVPYGVSKAGLNMLAQCLVKEVAEKEIRVNAVCPGFVDTEWQKEKPEWLRKKISEKTMMKRFGTPDEIADMCVAVCENTFMNGAIVPIDGGYDME